MMESLGADAWRPRPECRKCGARFGFLYSKPRFRRDPELCPDGELLWECDNCGYCFVSPTQEQRMAVPA